MGFVVISMDIDFLSQDSEKRLDKSGSCRTVYELVS